MQKKENTKQVLTEKQQAEDENSVKQAQKVAFNFDQNEKKKKEKSIEEEIMEKNIQQIEKTRLNRVFDILRGENDTFNRDDVTRELFLLLEQSENERKLTKKQKKDMKHEIDLISESMIWEVDENLDKQVDKREFELMYKRCIFDKTGLEPKSLFYMVQFLMFDKQEKKRITVEDTLELLYVNCTNYKLDSTLDSEIDVLFGFFLIKNQQTIRPEADQKSTTGQEKEITWKEYLEIVTERAITERRIKEEEKKKCKSLKKNEDSQY